MPVTPANTSQGRAILVQHSSNIGGSTVSSSIVAECLKGLGFNVHVVFAFDGPYIRILKERGFNVDVIGHNNWLRSSQVTRFIRNYCAERINARNFIQLFRKEKPELVYINTLVSVAPVLAADLLAIPTIWHLREHFANEGGELRCPSGLARQFVSRKVIGGQRTVVGVSCSVLKNVLGESRRKNIHVIPNAVSNSFFEGSVDKIAARRALDLPYDSQIIGMPGTLRPIKGHEFFLRSFKRVLETRNDALAVITGDGSSEYKKHLQILVKRLGLRDNVIFVGTLKNMRAAYRAFDITCIASMSETFGRTVIESYASGTPVIASNVGGIKEVITSGSNGILVPYGDVREMANAIHALLNDSDLRRRLVCEAHKDVRQKYTEAAHERLLAHVVNRALHMRGALHTSASAKI